MPMNSIRTSVKRLDTSFVIKISHRSASAEVCLSKTIDGFLPHIYLHDFIKMLDIGFSALVDDKKIINIQTQAYYRQMVEVYFTSQALGRFFRKRRYTSLKFLRRLHCDARISIMESEVWTNLGCINKTLPFIDRLTTSIIETPTLCGDLSSTDVYNTIFYSLFKCPPSVLKFSGFSNDEQADFLQRHSEWYNDIMHGPDSPFFEIGGARHLSMVSHRFRDLFPKKDKDRPVILFLQALKAALPHITRIFVYAANEICDNIAGLSDIDEVSKKQIFNFFLPRKWFGNAPLPIWLTYRPSPRQGKNKKIEYTSGERIPPVFEMLSRVKSLLDEFLPSEIYKICTYYSKLNDLERDFRPESIEPQQEEWEEIADSGGGTYPDEQIELSKDREKMLEHLKTHLIEADYELALDLLEYIGIRNIPWKKIIKNHSSYSTIGKLRDYWRKTLGRQLKLKLEKFLEGNFLEDETFEEWIKLKIRFL